MPVIQLSLTIYETVFRRPATSSIQPKLQNKACNRGLTLGSFLKDVLIELHERIGRGWLAGIEIF